MTHDELILLFEAATAGWHGAKATPAIADACFGRADGRSDDDELAYYHTRLAARAANRVINALNDSSLIILGGHY